MDNKVKVYIEIKKHTNIKYEYCKKENRLIVDRVLPYPFFYPYAYGFIPNTLAPDNDELDALILTNHNLKNDMYYTCYIIGVLKMEDEKGEDDKVLCVLEEDYEKINNINHLNNKIKNDLSWFFSNYKSSSPGKWSNVKEFENKETAVQIYLESKLN